MHVVQYAPGLRVPPVGYGGTERLVHWLARALARLGHRVTVVAAEGSTVGGDGIAFVPDSAGPLRRVVPPDADVLHGHVQVPAGSLPDLPCVFTEHGNRRDFDDYLPNTVFVSRSHAEHHGGRRYVHNGIPVAEYPLATAKDARLLFLARVDWGNKNAVTAVNAALDAGLPITVAGGPLWSTRKLWGPALLRAWLHRETVDVVGTVVDEAKMELLRRAAGLVHLVAMHEPFGLACHEALACGTPVVGTPNGALPEYVIDGENGWLVRDYDAAVAAIERVARMTDVERADIARRCRASAFTIEACARRYVALYEEVREGTVLHDPAEFDLRYRRPDPIEIRTPLARLLSAPPARAGRGPRASARPPR